MSGGIGLCSSQRSRWMSIHSSMIGSCDRLICRLRRIESARCRARSSELIPLTVPPIDIRLPVTSYDANVRWLVAIVVLGSTARAEPRFEVGAGTAAPLYVGAEATVHATHRLSFDLAVGWMPPPYVDTI